MRFIWMSRLILRITEIYQFNVIFILYYDTIAKVLLSSLSLHVGLLKFFVKPWSEWHLVITDTCSSGSSLSMSENVIWFCISFKESSCLLVTIITFANAFTFDSRLLMLTFDWSIMQCLHDAWIFLKFLYAQTLGIKSGLLINCVFLHFLCDFFQLLFYIFFILTC